MLRITDYVSRIMSLSAPWPRPAPPSTPGARPRGQRSAGGVARRLAGTRGQRGEAIRDLQRRLGAAEAFTADGWYRTGDIGHLDDHGRLILSGRVKDIIVLPNGLNVYPEDIEILLADQQRQHTVRP